ncbi:MAG: VOC family protein [Cyanobacteria bacterium]|jgi:predicted enzyme related to lactoylglutathione lyase|nr:VOC family protein [Cyanobacteria bacterium GSL.Bin1]
MTRNGEFNWMELQTHDPETAIEFYRATVGWEFLEEAMPTGGTYWLALVSGKAVCGFWTLGEGDSSGDRWITYIHVDDLEEAISRAKGFGAEVVREPWLVPGIGRVAMVRDPGGAEMGWVTPLHTGGT